MKSDLFTAGEKLAYAAGLIDGEGCVFVSGIPCVNPERFSLRILVQMTVSNPLVWLQENFGGVIRQATRDTRGRRWKTSWVWSVSSDYAESFLEKILPYMQVKAEEAAVGLLLHASLKSTNYSKLIPAETLEMRRLFWS